MSVVFIEGPAPYSGADPDIVHAQALAEANAGRLAWAIHGLAAALALDPQRPGSLTALADLHRMRHRAGPSFAALGRALILATDRDETWMALGLTEIETGQLAAAETHLSLALVLAPSRVEALVNLGNALTYQGRASRALRLYRRAVAVAPDRALGHNVLCFTLNYVDDVAPETVAEAHWRLGRTFAEPPAAPVAPAPRGPRGLSRLRIGYVSGDFRRHAVASFALPLMRHHDPGAVDLHFYANQAVSDDVTERYARLGQWRSIFGAPAERAAEIVAQDRIDVLVDLCGHSQGNRLDLMALKPAPHQATWLGYPNTTGLRAIDARLVDRHTDPPEAPVFGSERLVRLDPCFLPYAPWHDTPEPSPPPSLGSGVTFGSFNNLAKITDAVIATWARILHALPGSRLILKAAMLVDGMTALNLIRRFAPHGLGPDRIIAIGFMPGQEDHLSAYGLIDVALDTFPYCGTTTTCEALWMGVPVVTLAGRGHAARVGVSLLTNAGFPDWIAADPDDYVARAVALGRDTAGRARIRRALRQFLVAGPLCDARAFARRFETALSSL